MFLDFAAESESEEIYEVKDEIIVGEDDEMESEQQSQEAKEQPSTEETPQTSAEVKAEGKVSFDGVFVVVVFNVSFLC